MWIYQLLYYNIIHSQYICITGRTGASTDEVFIHRQPEPEQERNQNIESHDSTSGIERDESEPNKQKGKSFDC